MKKLKINIKLASTTNDLSSHTENTSFHFTHKVDCEFIEVQESPNFPLFETIPLLYTFEISRSRSST